jgi:hypothetical protein
MWPSLVKKCVAVNIEVEILTHFRFFYFYRYHKYIDIFHDSVSMTPIHARVCVYVCACIFCIYLLRASCLRPRGVVAQTKYWRCVTRAPVWNSQIFEWAMYVSLPDSAHVDSKYALCTVVYLDVGFGSP